MKPGLPLAASPVSTLTGDNVGAVKLVVRPIKRAKLEPVQISLQNSKGKVLSRKRIASPSGEPEIVSMPLRAAAAQPGHLPGLDGRARRRAAAAS